MADDTLSECVVGRKGDYEDIRGQLMLDDIFSNDWNNLKKQGRQANVKYLLAISLAQRSGKVEISQD
jgi:hypothetical protein